MRPSMRLAAILGLHVLYVFAHDSVAVGEDGPTHEPIEHAAALRAIPHLTDIRPSDANEAAVDRKNSQTAENAEDARKRTEKPCAL
jgi:transketolase